MAACAISCHRWLLWITCAACARDSACSGEGRVLCMRRCLLKRIGKLVFDFFSLSSQRFPICPPSQSACSRETPFQTRASGAKWSNEKSECFETGQNKPPSSCFFPKASAKGSSEKKKRSPKHTSLTISSTVPSPH